MKCYYFKGTFVETDNAKRLAVYELSRILGEKMTAKYPTAPILYWYMSNLAKWGEASGIMKAAKEGLADQLKELCEKVIALNPKYRNGAGYRMLGIIHYKTPYIPLLLSWPSNEEAIANLEKCLAMDPNDLMANLYLGQVLYDEGNEDRAIEVLQKTANSKPGAIEFLEDSKDIKGAKELLVKYKK